MTTPDLLAPMDATPDILMTLQTPDVQENRSHYRSKAFIPNVDINPLIASASSLFIACNKLLQANEPPDFTKLQQELSHEIRAFEISARDKNYHMHVILGARYALCAMLDELIYTRWENNHNWKDCGLLFAFQGEKWGGERFFIILARSMQEPRLYKDLLEFLYICFSFGFEGKFRHEERGHVQLGEIIDDLYYCIRRSHTHAQRNLLIGGTTSAIAIEYKNTWMSTILLLFIAASLLGGVYTFFSSRMQDAARTATQQFEQVNRNA